MIITRVINGIEIDIDVEKANEIYFDEEYANRVVDGDIDSILEILHVANGSKFSPLAITWETTSVCNFYCSFCYINQKEIPKLTKRFEEIKDDIDYLISNGLFICYLTGGEILAHPDFLEIYTYLKRNGVLVALLTNLSLLSDEHIDVFLKYKPYKIVTSIYGISREQFECVTSQNTIPFDKVLSNILKLKNHNIDVKCQTPINQLTENELSLIADWCYQNQIPYQASDELLTGYNDKQECAKVKDHDSFKENYKNINRLSNVKNGENIDFSSFGHKKHFDCRSGKYYFVLTYDYKIRPCFVFYGTGSRSFDLNNGMENAIVCLKEYLSEYKNKIIDYCLGCNAHEICNECIYTQSNQKDLELYMYNTCKKNQLKMNELINKEAN